LNVMTKQFKTPILFLIFNRPETTFKVFDLIRKIRPASLYISGDGPRNETEALQCEKARAVKDMVDWPCKVVTRYLDHNLGCRYGVSSGISWFFDQVEEGIIMEDDCMPDVSFFYFAQELLEKYRDDARVMHIGASNFQLPSFKIPESYYFSLYNHIWGWASWRRAWKHYQVDLMNIQATEIKQTLKGLFKRKIDQDFWLEMFKYAKSGNINTWDYQWMFAVWQQNGKAIIPAVNLISNIGFGAGGTNTQIVDQNLALVSHTSLAFPLIHNLDKEPHKVADQYTSDFLFKIRKNARYGNLKIKLARSLPVQVKTKIKGLMKFFS
jgi:hypothetical protein